MNPRLTQTTLIKIKCSDMASSLNPSIVQLKKSANPETITLKGNKSDIHKYTQSDQSINSPFQRDKFLYNYSHKPATRSSIHKRTYANDNLLDANRKMTEMKHPHVIRLEDMEISKDSLSKSWTYQSDNREIITFLQQIVGELSDKSEYDLARRYIGKVNSSFLNAKLLKVVEKLEEKGREKFPSEAMKFREYLIDFLKRNFKYERSIELASTDRLFKQLQKSVIKLRDVNIKSPRKQSNDKIRQLKQQSKHMNAKLQKQTRELQKTLQQERTKIKQSYEQIYRKIYEENSRLRRQIESREKEFQKQKEQNAQIKSKYENIFVQVSHEFKEIKLEYNKLINQTSIEAKKNKHLSEQFKFASERLVLEENKNRELEGELEKSLERGRFLEIDKANMENLCDKYKNYADKFLSQNKLYQTQKEKSMIDNQKQILENKEKEKILNNFQLKIQENELILLKQNQQMKANALLLQQNLKKFEQAANNTETLLQKQRQNQIQLYKFQKDLHLILEKKQKEEQSLKLVIQKKENMDSSLKILLQTLKSNEQNQILAKKQIEGFNSIMDNKVQQLRMITVSIEQQTQKLSNIKEQHQSAHISLLKASEQLFKLNKQIQKTKQAVKQQNLKKQSLQRQIQAISTEILEKKQRLFQLNCSIADKQKQLSNIIIIISERKTDLDYISTQMSKSREIYQKELNQKITLTTEILRMRQQIQYLCTQKQELMRENKAVTSHKKQTQNQLVSTQSASLQILINQRVQEQKKLSLIVQKIVQKHHQNRQLAQQMQSQQSQLNNINQSLKQCQDQYSRCRSNLQSILKEINIKGKHLQQISKQISQSSDELHSLQIKFIDLSSEYKKMEYDQARLRSTISSSKQENQEILQQIEINMQRLHKIQGQIESKVTIYQQLQQSIRNNITSVQNTKANVTAVQKEKHHAMQQSIVSMKIEQQTLQSSLNRSKCQKSLIEQELKSRGRELAKIKQQIEIKYEQLVCLQGDILIKRECYNTINSKNQ